jgi:hypothetical protein
VAIVADEPLLQRLVEVPGRIIPDEHEGPFPLGVKVCSQPREKGAGDPTDGTSSHKTPRHLARDRHRKSITGHGFPCGVLGWDCLFHQVDRLAVAPSMHLGLGLMAPLHLIFEAQHEVRLVGGHLDQPAATFFCSHKLGRG